MINEDSVKLCKLLSATREVHNMSTSSQAVAAAIVYWADPCCGCENILSSLSLFSQVNIEEKW